MCVYTHTRKFWSTTQLAKAEKWKKKPTKKTPSQTFLSTCIDFCSMLFYEQIVFRLSLFPLFSVQWDEGCVDLHRSITLLLSKGFNLLLCHETIRRSRAEPGREKKIPSHHIIALHFARSKKMENKHREELCIKMKVHGDIKRLWRPTSHVNVDIFQFLLPFSQRNFKQNAQISTTVCQVAKNNTLHIFVKPTAACKSSHFCPSCIHGSFVMSIKCLVHRPCLWLLLKDVNRPRKTTWSPKVWTALSKLM